MAETVGFPVAHPMKMSAGRTSEGEPGPQDRTVGKRVVVVVGTTVVVVVGATVVVLAVRRAMVVVVVAMADLFGGGGELDPTVNPMARPTPRAAMTATTMPTRTTVVRRNVMTGGSLTIGHNATCSRSQK